MDKESVLSLQAGEELNKLVSDFMGKEEDWSNSISAAWEVVEKQEFPEVKKAYRENGVWYWGACFNGEWVYGKTAPEAICKAALLAVME